MAFGERIAVRMVAEGFERMCVDQVEGELKKNNRWEMTSI
jgi:hypothetical protein